METETNLGIYNVGTHQQFEITVTRNDARVFIALVGEFDCDVERGVMDMVLRAASGPGIETLQIDIAGVTFIDSSGVRCLLLARQTAIKANLGFTLNTAGNPDVLRVLDICGMTATLEDRARVDH